MAKVTGSKYTETEAITQLEKAIARIKKHHLSIKLEIIEGKNKHIMEVCKDFEEMKKHKDMVAEKKITPEDEKLTGWANFPMLCLHEFTTIPILQDLVKHDTLKHEFYHLKPENNKMLKKKKNRHLGAFAGLIGEVVRIG